jgi:polar amino acid transport system substrate-binding protein
VDSALSWKERVVVAYLDEPPFFAPLPDSDPVGCDIELVTTVLTDLDVGDVEFVLTTFEEMIPGLRSGRWTVNSPMFVTVHRATLVDFSVPVWAIGDGFIVRRDDLRDFSSYESIADDGTIVLAVVADQVQHDTAVTAGVPLERIVVFATQAEAARAVIAGGADASASTAPGNFAYLQRADDHRLTSVVDRGDARQHNAAVGAFSFDKATPEFSSAFNTALRSYLGSEHHLDMMSRYGFGESDLAPVLRHR